MRVIEDRCPFSNTAAAAMGKKRRSQTSNHDHMNHYQYDTSDEAAIGETLCMCFTLDENQDNHIHRVNEDYL